MTENENNNNLVGKVVMVAINFDTSNIGAILEYTPYKNIIMDVKKIYIRDEQNIAPLPEREHTVDMVASIPFVGYNQYIDSITVALEQNNEYILNNNYIYKANDNIGNIDGNDNTIIRNLRLNYLPDNTKLDNSNESTRMICYSNKEYYKNNPEQVETISHAYQKVIRRII